jgi:glycine betaine/proline transport system substrate-binding protein
MKIIFGKISVILLAVVLSLALFVTGCPSDDNGDGDGNGGGNGDGGGNGTVDTTPGNGTTVTPARATWDTGWFQVEIYIKALEELGYDVDDPVTLDNPPFYTAVGQGDVDFWANGWFPIHNTYMEGNDGATIIGEEAVGGALQGYLIDKATAEEYGITSIEQFQDPDIAALFDSDGDGLANLVACPPGWGCELVITHQMEAYDLLDTVEAVKAQYTVAMVDAISRYQAGEPIFFYTWTPNWTVAQLVPGEDVVWLEVPFASLPESQAEYEDATFISGLEGKAGDSEPYNMGWPVNDIQVVANVDFLEDNPAAEYILENVVIPLEDIFAQNGLMFDGEDTPADIERHAEEWIEANQATFDAWIEGAIEAAN